MTSKSLETLSDEILLQMAAPASSSVESEDIPEFSDNYLLEIAQRRLSDSVDTQSGAPAGVRAQVAAAQKPEDKLATLQKFFPDASPVEAFDPDYGATKFGRGNFVFTNPETGKLTLFDEDIRLFGIPIPTLGDVADVGPEIAETVGGIGTGALAAAAAGTATSPTVVGAIPAATAAFVAGEGVGSATAREAYIGILDFFGETEDNRTGLERLGDFSTTAVLNAAAGPIVSKLIDGVKFVAGQPIRYVSRAMSVPAKEAFERMTRSGVSSPTMGQVTGSPLFNLVENSVLANLPTSTVTMRKNAQQTLVEIDDAVKQLTNEYGGARTTSDAAYKVMDGAQAARARYDEKRNQMYAEIGELIPDDVVSPAASTIRFVEKYLAASKSATGKDDLAPALRQAEKVLADAKDGLLTYDRLKDFRSSLMATVRKAESQGALNKPEQRVNELIGYVSKDLDDLVGSAAGRQMDLFGEQGSRSVGEDILAKYKAANEFVANNMKKGGDIAFIDEVIRKGESEATAALKYIIGGTKEGGERVEKLRRQFEPEEYNVLSGYMLGKLGIPGAGAVGGALDVGEAGARQVGDFVSDQGFSPATFLRRWEGLSPEAKKELFGGTEYADLMPALDDLVFTMERVSKAAADMGNPSGTSRAIYAMGMLGVLGEGTGVARALGSEGFEYGLGSLIGPYASAKLMTNKDFVKWLSGAAEKAVYNPKSFGQHVRRLGQIFQVNPDIRDEIRGVLQGLTQESIEPLPFEGSKSAPTKTPENNELSFRQSVPKSTADKVLPSTDELMARASEMRIPDVDLGTMNMFEPLEGTSVAPRSPATDAAMIDPAVLPRAEDRAIAARRSGIAGLV